MQLHKRTSEQIQSDISGLKRALLVPNIPQDEAIMHRNLIKTLEDELSLRNPPQSGTGKTMGIKVPQGPNPSPRQIERNGQEHEQMQRPRSREILAGGMVSTTGPITSSIEVAANTDPHNPKIKITFSDGYQIEVDETAASGRFKSTLRDCCNLRCVAEGRESKMWRWDTPWRCAGFYQALTQFWAKQPSLKEIGITHPTDRQKLVFSLILEKAEKPES